MAARTPNYEALLTDAAGREIIGLRQGNEHPVRDTVSRVATVDPITGRMAELPGLREVATGLARAQALEAVYRQRQQDTLAPISTLPPEILDRYAQHGGLREIIAAAEQYGAWAEQAASAASAQEGRIVHTAGVHTGENPNRRLPDITGGTGRAGGMDLA